MKQPVMLDAVVLVGFINVYSPILTSRVIPRRVYTARTPHATRRMLTKARLTTVGHTCTKTARRVCCRVRSIACPAWG